MVYDWSTMAGRVQTSLNLTDLAAQLAATGLRVAVRKRIGPNGDYYIRIYEGDDCTLERGIPDGYLADGLSSSVEQMFAGASKVSKGLTEINIRHRFEVYDWQSRLVHYLHHPGVNPEEL